MTVEFDGAGRRGARLDLDATLRGGVIGSRLGPPADKIRRVDRAPRDHKQQSNRPFALCLAQTPLIADQIGIAHARLW